MRSPIELGAFRLENKVNGGANGDVWRGTHPETGLPVAVKVLKAELSLKEGAAKGFRNEVRAMAALHHPHIASIFAVLVHHCGGKAGRAKNTDSEIRMHNGKPIFPQSLYFY